MARRQVIEVICDRCKRTETQGHDAFEKKDQTQKEAVLTFHGETTEYGDLCRRCRESVKNYYLRMTLQPVEGEVEKEPDKPVDLAEASQRKGLGR